MSLLIKRFAWVLSAPPELKRPCGFHTSKYFVRNLNSSVGFVDCHLNALPRGLATLHSGSPPVTHSPLGKLTLHFHTPWVTFQLEYHDNARPLQLSVALYDDGKRFWLSFFFPATLPKILTEPFEGTEVTQPR